MRWMLILFICFYRLLPTSIKRDCLFRETCSLFVLRVTREGGFFAGCLAAKSRLTKCRPGYSVRFNYALKDWEIELANGALAGSSEIADFVLEPYRAALDRACERSAADKRIS
jgi:uncharacterized protein